MTSLEIRQISERPRLYVIEDFVSNATIEHIEALTVNEEQLLKDMPGAKRDETGFSAELPVSGDAVLEDLRQRIADILDFANSAGSTLRFRRYQKGNYHPLHPDNYAMEGLSLIATFLVCLTDVDDGGETHFPHAKPFPVKVRPKKGRAMLWFNHALDGSDDDDAVHECLPIVDGVKTTITSFSYGLPESAANVIDCAPLYRDRNAMMEG